MKILIRYGREYHFLFGGNPGDRYVDVLYLVDDNENVESLKKKWKKECGYVVKQTSKKTGKTRNVKKYTQDFCSWMEQFSINFEEL